MNATDKPPAPHPVRYWLQDQPDSPQNFGDFLTELFLDRLFVLPSVPADAYHLVGSVISEWQIQDDLRTMKVRRKDARVAFWGCGMRQDDPLSPKAMGHATFHGVRGPLTRDLLGLPADTVLGDPGLLAPLLHPPPRRRKGGTLCVVHLLDPQPLDDIARMTGADRVVRAGITGTQAALGQMLDAIAGADFVLCGALHAAIVAAAYGVPFAFFDSGYVDVPFKWRDFAASVGIAPVFATTLAQGRTIHADSIRPHYRPPPLTPILAVAPFAVRHAMLACALHHDGHIGRAALNRLLCAHAAAGIDNAETIAAAQARWAATPRRHR